MKTIKDVFLNFHHALDSLYGAQETEAITLMVISQITALSRAKIKAFPEDDLPAGAAEKLLSILNELKTGKPVQYILGDTEFYGLRFLVNPAVLIPRPETEELVAWALESLKSKVKSEDRLSILDIGTGSGCIAISIKKKMPSALVTGMDISAGALKTAAQNAMINEVDVRFVEADILIEAGMLGSPEVGTSESPKQGKELLASHSPFPNPNSPLTIHHSPPTTPYSLIISNPPYVTPREKTLMHTNVTDFEPHSALFVPEDDPLLFYKAIAAYAATNLVTGGLLFLEINENFGPQTVGLLNNKNFMDVELRQDMSVRDRMIKAVNRN